MSQKFVAILGNLSDGFQVVGPFNSFAAAADWSTRYNQNFGDWIVSMESPEEYNQRMKQEKETYLAQKSIEQRAAEDEEENALFDGAKEDIDRRIKEEKQ